MKKLIITAFIISSQISRAEGTPLTIEYKWKSSKDTAYCDQLRQDPKLCCHFSIVASKTESSEDVVVIRHSKTGVVLGTFYGRPPKIFIIEVCEKYGYFDTVMCDKIAEAISKN